MSKFDKEHAVSLAPSTAPSTQESGSTSHLVNHGTVNFNSCNVKWVDVDCILNLIILNGIDGSKFFFENFPGGKYIARGDCNVTLGYSANCTMGLDDFNDLLPSIITPNLDSTSLPTVSHCVADYILKSGCPP